MEGREGVGGRGDEKDKGHKGEEQSTFSYKETLPLDFCLHLIGLSRVTQLLLGGWGPVATVPVHTSHLYRHARGK